jgi:hypothetical protein
MHKHTDYASSSGAANLLAGWTRLSDAERNRWRQQATWDAEVYNQEYARYAAGKRNTEPMRPPGAQHLWISGERQRQWEAIRPRLLEQFGEDKDA